MFLSSKLKRQFAALLHLCFVVVVFFYIHHMFSFCVTQMLQKKNYYTLLLHTFSNGCLVTILNIQYNLHPRG